MEDYKKESMSNLKKMAMYSIGAAIIVAAVNEVRNGSIQNFATNTLKPQMTQLVNNGASKIAQSVIESKIKNLRELKVLNSYGNVTCEADKIYKYNCLIENIDLNKSSFYNKDINIGELEIKNPEDLVKQEKIFGEDSNKSSLTAEDLKTNTKVIFKNILINNESALNELNSNIDKALSTKYKDSNITEIKNILKEELSNIDISIAIKTKQAKKGNINNITTISIMLPKTVLTLSLDITTPLIKSTNVNINNLKDIIVNRLSFELNKSNKDFISKLMEISYKIENGDNNATANDYKEELTNLKKQISDIIDLDLKNSLEANIRNDLKEKMINILNGKDSSFKLEVGNNSGESIIKSLSKYNANTILNSKKGISKDFNITIE